MQCRMLSDFSVRHWLPMLCVCVCADTEEWCSCHTLYSTYTRRWTMCVCHLKNFTLTNCWLLSQPNECASHIPHTFNSKTRRSRSMKWTSGGSSGKWEKCSSNANFIYTDINLLDQFCVLSFLSFYSCRCCVCLFDVFPHILLLTNRFTKVDTFIKYAAYCGWYKTKKKWEEKGSLQHVND